MQSDIFRYIRTKQEADSVLAALHSISQEIFVGKETALEVVLQKYLSVEISQVLIDQLIEGKTVSAKRQKLLEIIKKLDVDIRGLSAFTLTMAIVPTQKMVEHIYQAVEAFLGASVVLDIRYDPDICAGAKIVWKGLYRDYSVASKIDLLFATKQKEIGEMVK